MVTNLVILQVVVTAFNMYTGYSRGLVKIDSIAFDVLEMIVVTPALQSPAGVAEDAQHAANTSDNTSRSRAVDGTKAL